MRHLVLSRTMARPSSSSGGRCRDLVGLLGRKLARGLRLLELVLCLGRSRRRCGVLVLNQWRRLGLDAWVGGW